MSVTFEFSCRLIAVATAMIATMIVGRGRGRATATATMKINSKVEERN